jgi:hypothetical protein
VSIFFARKCAAFLFLKKKAPPKGCLFEKSVAVLPGFRQMHRPAIVISRRPDLLSETQVVHLLRTAITQSEIARIDVGIIFPGSRWEISRTRICPIRLHVVSVRRKYRLWLGFIGGGPRKI